MRFDAFAIAGAAAGLAGGLSAFSKGSVFPSYISDLASVDALLMVLLGGVQTISGPIVGALVYTGLFDLLLLATDLWRLVLGAAIVVLVLAFPGGHCGRRAEGMVARALGVSVLSVEGLKKSFGGVRAVGGVSFGWRRARCWR